MEFKKYQHIERLGTTECQDIEIGECYIFYKIDGTNSSLWLNENNEIRGGSRNRELTLDNDNAGFYNFAVNNPKIKAYFEAHPTHRLFGEWLIPHSLKTYRKDAWRRFYIFDVCINKNTESDEHEYIPYNIYKDFLDEFELDYIPPLAIIKNPTYESLIKCLEKTGQFLVEDGKGNGEGIVIKNYNYYNKYGRQNWAKIVSNEFKEQHHKVIGCPEFETEKMVEVKIVEKFCTDSFIEKEFSKIVASQGEWSSKFIPMLLSTIFHELITEEIWHILKEFNNPKIDFKTLNTIVINRIKECKREIFN